MYAHFLFWQFVLAPKWLLVLYGRLQLSLLRYFSVGIMFKTLLSPWHKDSVPYLNQGISGMFRALALNSVSRGAGLVVRSFVLVAWVALELLLLVFGAWGIVLFMIWPLVVLALFATGLALIIAA